MVYSDNFTVLTDEKKAQYKVDFCIGCALYDECELVEEYTRFRNSHSPNPESTIPQVSGGIPKVKATVRIGGREITPLPSSGSPVIGGSGTDRLSYNHEELRDGCIMSNRHVYPIPCGEQRVADGVGKHYQIELRKDYTLDIATGTPDRWEPSQPVFISAQTGQGKNFFIENTLIPYVRDVLNYKNNTDQKVLILSNRLALQQQIKSRLKGNDDIDDAEGRIYHYGDCADVMTYQSLLQREETLKKIQAKAHSRYIYTICDEAHFFTSDAMFNPHTSEILSAIVRLFQNAIRIYMSATPYDCLEYIIKYEREYRSNSNKPQYKDESSPMAFYHFERNYSYLDVKAYSSIAELYEQIVKSVNKKKETDREKWLIFIDDKEKGEAVKGKLLAYEKERANEHGWPQVLNGADEETAKDGKAKGAKATAKAERILVANAKSKTDESYMSMVKSEELGKGTYVLITTSVLDNGVNLKGINNVVVSDMAKVKCLQMVGRARTCGEDDRKTLYIKRFGGGEVGDRLKGFDRQKAAYHNYNLAYGESRDSLRSRTRDINEFLDKYYHGSSDDWYDAEHWFGHPVSDSTKLYFNEIAKSLLDRLVPQYQAIYNEMLEEGPKAGEPQAQEGVNRTGQKYLEYQFSWFGKTYCKDDDMTFADKDKDKKAFIAFLEAYADSGEIIDGKEQMDAFCDKFTTLYDAVYPRATKDKDRSYKHLKMNILLKERSLEYEITGQPQNGPWQVVRTNITP
ncbi:MAG: DEAD/DEAH box helicase family protein [Oscillibacter sp.]|nr:DEAD/DEAH box helicase family protein [Oscillibacter sp.]